MRLPAMTYMVATILGCTPHGGAPRLASTVFPDTAAVHMPDASAYAIRRLGLGRLRRAPEDTATVYRIVRLSFSDEGFSAFTIRREGDSATLESRDRAASGPVRVSRRALSGAEWEELTGYEDEWQLWAREGRGAAWAGFDGGITLLESVVAGEYRAWSTMEDDIPLSLFWSWLRYHAGARPPTRRGALGRTARP